IDDVMSKCNNVFCVCFFQAEDGIRDRNVTGVQTCALPIFEKTRSSLRTLMDMAPEEATVIKNGEHVTVPVEEINEGDRVVIQSGEKVAVDGKVVSGEAYINEATITGESIPANKLADDHVFSGTIIDHGYIEVEAKKVGDDTAFAKIIELVEEAQETKAKTQKFLDRFAEVYTPGILVLSIFV